MICYAIIMNVENRWAVFLEQVIFSALFDE